MSVTDQGSEGARGPISRGARVVALVVSAAALVVVGFVGGWVSGGQSATPREGGEHAGHADGGATAGQASGAPTLSRQTLANLGVEVAPLALSEFVRTREVVAEVALPPGSVRSLRSPVAGIVRRVHARAGQAVASGQPLLEVLRDPFPRPTLSLTDAILRPLNEDYHRTVTDLRTTAVAAEIARRELERVRAALRGPGGAASPPTKTEVDLAYEVTRQETALETARHEAERHGLTDAQRIAIERAEGRAPDHPPVLTVLRHHAMWGELADRTLALLPEPQRDRRHAQAVVAELYAAGRVTDALVDALTARPSLAAAFLDLAGLLQQGESVEALLALDDAEALGSVVRVDVPAGLDAAEVVDLPLREGAPASRGAELAVLRDSRRVWLRLRPSGPDVAPVLAAFTAAEPLAAEPLVPGAGPRREGIRLLRLEDGVDGASPSAIAEIENQVAGTAKAADGAPFRSWKLHAGVRYVVGVPVARTRDRFVLPADAVVSRGADWVVLLETGSTFRVLPVALEHRDARVAVISGSSGGVFPGDRVVVRGAYALSLALQAGTGGAADPHAGHQH